MWSRTTPVVQRLKKHHHHNQQLQNHILHKFRQQIQTNECKMHVVTHLSYASLRSLASLHFGRICLNGDWGLPSADTRSKIPIFYVNKDVSLTKTKLQIWCVVWACISLSVVVISSWTASMSLASRVRYWQRRSSCCRAMAMRRDRLCMQLMTDGSAFACRPEMKISHFLNVIIMQRKKNVSVTLWL